MTHTPTPIECRGFTDQYGYTLTDFNGVVFARVQHGNNGSTAEENRDFVIKAVNCHDELITHLEHAILRVEMAHADGDDILSAWLPRARAAIARAREG